MSFFCLLMQLIASYKSKFISDGEYDYIWSHYIQNPMKPYVRFIGRNNEVFKYNDQSNYFIYNCFFKGLQDKSIEIKNKNSKIMDSSCTFDSCSDTAVYVQCKHAIHRRICASNLTSSYASNVLLSDTDSSVQCFESTFILCGSTKSSFTILMSSQGNDFSISNSNITKCIGGITSSDEKYGKAPAVVYLTSKRSAEISSCSISDCNSSGFIIYFNANDGLCNRCNIIGNKIIDQKENEQYYIIGYSSHLQITSSYESDNNVALFNLSTNMSYLESSNKISFLHTAFCQAVYPLTELAKPIEYPRHNLICSCMPDVYRNRIFKALS